MKTIQMMAGGTGMGGAKEMAEMLRRMGRNGDTMLAHITPEEAELLADLGGAGTSNPDTGLPEFFNVTDFDSYDSAFNRIPDADINDIVDQARLDRARSRQPVSAYQETEPNTDIFRQDYSQPRQTTMFDTGASSYRGVDVPRDIFAPRARTGDTISADYLRDTNLRGGGDFEQIPALRQPASSLGTYRGVTVPTDIFAKFEPLQDQTAALQAQEEPGFAARAEGRLKELQDVLNQYPNLTRAGTAGAGILAQALLFNRANRAMKRDIEETRRAAEPFRAAQAEAMGRATGGGLTPEQEQDLEIAQARARQGLGERGLQTGSAASGVLAAQQRRARSLARQEGFQEALRLANIADQYDRRALEMELQRDQQLGQLFASIVGREVQQAQRTNAPATTTTTQQP
jgi:hypothetical protein